MRFLIIYITKLSDNFHNENMLIIIMRILRQLNLLRPHRPFYLWMMLIIANFEIF
jgi:hypothetical protein